MSKQIHHARPWILHGHVLGADHGAILAACAASGVQAVELHCLHLEDCDESALERLSRQYRAAGVAIESFHLPFTARDDIASLYERERRHSVERVRYWLERLPVLGVRVGIQHPGALDWDLESEGAQRILDRLRLSLEELLPVAEAGGIQIALENMPPYGGRVPLGAAPEHFARIFALVDHPCLGICLDTGHALMAGGDGWIDPYFDSLGARICAFHLADNSGNRDLHIPPGHGRVDWTHFFRRLAQIPYAHGLCVEAPPFAPGPPFRDEDWCEMFDLLDRMVERARDRG